VEYYEQYSPPRPVGYITKDNPGTEVLADGAATLAAAVALLGDAADPAWRASALDHARQLYAWGKEFPGSYADSKDEVILIMQDMYPSDGKFDDDLAWAATWLYVATNESRYLADARASMAKLKVMESASFETGDKTPGAAVLLAAVAGDARAMADAQAFFDQYLSLEVDHTAAGAAQPYHWYDACHAVCIAPMRALTSFQLPCRGSNRHVGNMAFLAQVHGRNPGVEAAYAARLTNYGHHQANYLLGDAGRSWVVGFGKDYPQFMHHKMVRAA
jgi:hypothetical protein